MTIRTEGDWNDQRQFRMIWNICNQADKQAAEDKIDELRHQARAGEISPLELHISLSRCYHRVRLDLSVPDGVPDGLHQVFHRSGWRDLPPEGVASGVVVRDGQFDPHSTEAAVYAAVCRSYGIPDQCFQSSPYPVIDHVYIQAFVWDADTQRLEVITGS